MIALDDEQLKTVIGWPVGRRSRKSERLPSGTWVAAHRRTVASDADVARAVELALFAHAAEPAARS